jgi:putative ABC transport system substrate-binding protein
LASLVVGFVLLINKVKMKNLLKIFAFVLVVFSSSSHSLEALSPDTMDEPKTVRIEVLQVTDIEPYQKSLDGFLKTLKENGIVLGKNLEINRVKVDFDVENGGFWDKLGVVLRIKQEAERIARVKPDLVLTIGTAATKYSRTILSVARIPVVFTAVADPLDADCTSLSDAGPGVTGATLYMDMTDSLKIVKQVFPVVKSIGMVHTDDVNGIAHVENARASARDFEINVASQAVDKKDSIIPALKTLYEEGKGVQMFAVPLDTYYGLRKYEPTMDLSEFGSEYHVPVISFAMMAVPGAALYIGADFEVVGGLSAQQAVKILKLRKKPDLLAILKQKKPTVLVNPERLAELKLKLPASMADKKTVRSDGLWLIGSDK